MIWTFFYADELCQPIHSAEHVRHALIALGRNTGIVRVARHADLILLSHGDHTIEEVSDPFPEHARVHAPGARQRRIWVRIPQSPGAVGCIAAAAGTSSAQHAQNAHVVLDRGYARRRAIPDQHLQRFDIAAALGTLREHDGRMFLAVDVARGQERRSNAIHTDPVFLREIAHAPEFFDGRIDAVPRDFGIAADITDPVPREVFQMGVIGRSALAP